VVLRARASTSAVRYKEAGYVRRVLRNWWCVALYLGGASQERLERVYYG